MLHVRLFGTTGVVAGGGRVLGPGDFGGVKPRRVLEALALHRGNAVTKDRLVDVLWRDRPPRDHTATLESYVSLLRRRLEPGTPPRRSAVRTVHGGYLLDTARARTDLDLFDALVARAGRAGGGVALRLLDRASLLASGELIPPPGETQWAEPVRVDYRQRAVRAALRGAELALRGAEAGLFAGGADAAVRLARRALDLDQLCEPAWRLLMSAHLAGGRRDAGLRSYGACRRLLADELGIGPSPETQAVLLRLVGVRAGQRRPGQRRSGQQVDIGTVLDAAFDLFERGSRRTGAGAGMGAGVDVGRPPADQPPVAGRPGAVDDAVCVLTGLLHRAGVDTGLAGLGHRGRVHQGVAAP